ncbi:MAG: cytidylate kinase [Proteobacteria bacterium ST_bin12]|nr:MAG: cytidylate kinase [Proteobacteria bacterium ST_bin12]
MTSNSSLSVIPVIAIDGPSASGKGTVAQLVAERLNFHYLDSGALYRIVAFAAYKNNTAWSDADKLGELAKSLKIEFSQNEIYLNDDHITEAVRSEEMSRGASEVAIHQPVRSALMDLQRSFRQAPGLVGDGRDMGSVIFKDAMLKIFLTACVQVRAERRYKQLINKGLSANYENILADLQSRDERDSQRSAAPLIQTADALLLDTSQLNIEQAMQFVLNAYQKYQSKH